MSRFILSLIFCLAGCGATPLYAGSQPVAHLDAQTRVLDLRPYLSLWLDRYGSATVDEAEARLGQFRRAPGSESMDLNLGYHHGAAWLRVNLAAAPDAPRNWLLEVGNPTLDQVSIFLPDGKGNMVAQGADDHAAGRPYFHRYPVFPVQIPAGGQQILLLRVTSDNSMTIPVKLWQLQALDEHDHGAYAVLGLYYGLLLALLAYNLLVYQSRREPINLIFAWLGVSLGIGMLGLNGLGKLWLWPSLTLGDHYAFPLGMAFFGLSGALFNRAFLRTRDRSPVLDFLLLAMAFIFAALILTGGFIHYHWLLLAVSIAGLVGSLLAIVSGLAFYIAGQREARYLVLAWTLLLVGLATSVARDMAWLPSYGYTLYALQVGSALFMLLAAYALTDRASLLGQEDLATNASKLAAKEVTLAALRVKEAQLEKRVEERTRELAFVNEGLRENLARQLRLATRDPLTGLANRMLLDDRLDQALERARRTQGQVGVALIDLNDFKPINDNYGHDAGDRLLIEVADRLSKSMRASDTVARYGGDEFVVVMERVHGRDDVRRLISAVDTALAVPIREDSLELTVSASIGVSMYPDDGDQANMLLRKADEAMYAEKRARKQEYSGQSTPPPQ